MNGQLCDSGNRRAASPQASRAVIEHCDTGEFEITIEPGIEQRGAVHLDTEGRQRSVSSPVAGLQVQAG
jgi:hypothetical protein